MVGKHDDKKRNVTLQAVYAKAHPGEAEKLGRILGAWELGFPERGRVVERGMG